MLVDFATDQYGMPSAPFVIKEGEHIYINVKLILVEMNIVWRNRVPERIEMIAGETFLFCNEWLACDVFIEVVRVQGSNECRSRSSARCCFEY